MVKIDVSELEAFLNQLFLKYGASEAEAKEVASHLVISNLMGHDSHGIIRAPWYIEKIQKGEIVPGASIEIENETASSAMVNGNWGFGQPIAKFAMKIAIEKAEKQVVSCITVRNCNHVGRLGAYTSMASDNGMVAIGMANLHGTSHCVAPFGGIDAKLPTNPISIAFPCKNIPNFLLDMTSSMVAEGKVKIKHYCDEQLPEGWVIDHDGNPASKSSQFYNSPRGAILPLGGASAHKGFALAMAIDVLSGALSRAQCSNPDANRHGNACLFMAIKIDAFIPVKVFTDQVDKLVKHTKSARLAKGTEKILMPGEPEYYTMKRLSKEGIVLNDKIWAQIIEKAKAVDLDSSKYVNL